MRLDAADAIHGVDDGPERTARRRGDTVGYALGNAHAARRREDVAVLREAAHEVRKALAIGPHVLLFPATERGRVLHAALVALAAVHVRPQEAIALAERLTDRVLAQPRTERYDRAHHLVAQDDRQLRRRQR